MLSWCALTAGPCAGTHGGRKATHAVGAAAETPTTEGMAACLANSEARERLGVGLFPS